MSSPVAPHRDLLNATGRPRNDSELTDYHEPGDERSHKYRTSPMEAVMHWQRRESGTPTPKSTDIRPDEEDDVSSRGSRAHSKSSSSLFQRMRSVFEPHAHSHQDNRSSMPSYFTGTGKHTPVQSRPVTASFQSARRSHDDNTSYQGSPVRDMHGPKNNSNEHSSLIHGEERCMSLN